MVEDYLVGFFLSRTCQETLKINGCLFITLVMRNGNLIIFLSTVEAVSAFFFFIKKQLISLLVTFGPTAKDSKVSVVSILPPENLRWRCHC